MPFRNAFSIDTSIESRWNVLLSLNCFKNVYLTQFLTQLKKEVKTWFNALVFENLSISLDESKEIEQLEEGSVNEEQDDPPSGVTIWH